MIAIDVGALESSVEALIQQQLAVYEAQLREALARALTKTRPGASPKPVKPKAPPARRPSWSERRPTEQLEALAARLLSVMEAMPGQTMAVLAPHLGLSSRELERPAARLKKTGRVRTVGERNRMRYYPMGTAQ